MRFGFRRAVSWSTRRPSSPAASDDTAFPCDVYAVLETNCAPCHAGNMYVVPLKTRDIWLAARSGGMSYGQYAADQVAAEKMPPPTAPTQPSARDRALLVDWVAAGMPAGPCGPLTPPSPDRRHAVLSPSALAQSQSQSRSAAMLPAAQVRRICRPSAWRARCSRTAALLAVMPARAA